MEALQELYDARDFDRAWSELVEHARTVTDFAKFVRLCSWRDRLLAEGPRRERARTLKIALLGGATTEFLERPLALVLDTFGLGGDILRADYNTFAREMLDPSSATVAFKPDVAIVMTTPANLPRWPEPGADRATVQALVTEVVDYWLELCAGLHQNAHCDIVLGNFHPLKTRPLGNLGAKIPWDANSFLRRVNLELASRAPSYVHINDVESLAAQHGIDRWFDTRFWLHAKQPVSFECALPLLRNTARVVAAIFGVTAKCLVLDLDNTLWGGVVGDDGPDGIKIGEGDAVSEAFKAFQDYVVQLKRRGVLLAVSSKNEEVNALAAFRERAEMVLKRDDFVAFKANWRHKPDNLREIAAELNICLDAMVFVDDNPVERNLVRRSLPEVKVVELTADPADYPVLVDRAAHFEVVALTAEDAGRTHQYRANEERERLRVSAGDYKNYLASLEQRAAIGPFDDGYLDRIVQLTNKSNQFNLTTLRVTRSDIEALVHDRDALTAQVRLADRFGDNGLISVFFARRDGEALRIDAWLMSCRVLKRGVEELLCNHVVERARAMEGVRFLDGSYRPTPRNELVRDHYRTLGFTHLADGEDGVTHWRLDLATFRPFDVAIDILEVLA